jgi:glyoxylase-like metal-dependent hydrolase (beta-lactamase superfamily II)
MADSSLTIDVDALRERLERGEPTVVLDVRPATEHDEWSIPGSVHIDAYHALRARDPNALAGIELPRDVLVVTVCAAGNTSKIAAEQLRERGIPARTLVGGMKAWSLAWNIAEVVVTHSDVRIIQVRRTGKGCLSYLIASGKEAAVVDASLPTEVYLRLAQARDWVVRFVLETHVHADHLSRSRQLAKQCGARLFLPRQDRVSFEAEWIDEGDIVPVGQCRLHALRTPGHTGESTCYVIDDGAVLTGDTLFLTSVGRPDLEAGIVEAREHARMLHASLRRLMSLDPDILVLPGHTSEPVAFDPRAIAAPLGEVKAKIALLGRSEAAFIEEILGRLPPAPPKHQQIVRLNEAGSLPEVDPTDLEAGANRCAVT